MIKARLKFYLKIWKPHLQTDIQLEFEPSPLGGDLILPRMFQRVRQHEIRLLRRQFDAEAVGVKTEKKQA